MTENNTLKSKCYGSLASDTCPACQKKKKPKQSFCLKCYRKLPRTVQQGLYIPAGYPEFWNGALGMLGVQFEDVAGVH